MGMGLGGGEGRHVGRGVLGTGLEVGQWQVAGRWHVAQGAWGAPGG